MNLQHLILALLFFSISLNHSFASIYPTFDWEMHQCKAMDWKVTFDASNSKDVEGKIASYKWEIRGIDVPKFFLKKKLNQPIFAADFPSLGNYQVILTVTGVSGQEQSLTALISLKNDKEKAPYTVKHFALGDFDGDQKSDVLLTTDDGWYISFAGHQRPEKVNSISIQPPHMKMGDFDGDGITDCFYASTKKKQWLVSFGASTEWQVLKSDPTPLSNLLLGDFDGNGKTDVFTIRNKSWLVSFDGTNEWTEINNMEVSLSNLHVGDFDSDGKDDILVTKLADWQFYPSGAGHPQTLLSQPAPYYLPHIDGIRFVDFDGDNKTDMLQLAGTRLRVLKQDQDHKTVAFIKVNKKELAFAELNGDGKMDLIYRHPTGLYAMISGTSDWQQMLQGKPYVIRDSNTVSVKYK